MKKAVLVSGFNWYESRLKPVSEVLEEEGYTVSFYLSDFSHESKSYFTDKIQECNYIHVPSYDKNMSIARLFSHMVFGHKFKRIIRREKPDLIYCMIPPNSVAPPCLKYKESHPKSKYYLDIIDLWPESIPIEEKYKRNVIFKKWGHLRDDSLLVSDHVFSECRLYQNRLKNMLNPDKVSTLYLFKEISDKGDVLKCIAEKRKKYKKNKISLCYLGSINNLIDIDKICKIISSIVKTGITVEFRVIGIGESKDKLLQSTERTGANVKYYGSVYERSKKLKILGSCDYGFNIMKDVVTVGLTIKSVDYFSMGIPIINGIKGDTWEFVEQENIGVNYEGNKNSIVHSLLEGIENRSINAFNCFENNFTKEVFKQTVREALNHHE